MSAEATFWAWAQHAVKGNNKLVLLCYADYANDKGYSWPGKGTVSIKCGISKATVKRCVAWLICEGFLVESGLSSTTTSDNKTRETVKYRLPVPSSLSPSSSGFNMNPVQNEPGSIDLEEEDVASGVKMNPVAHEAQDTQGEPSGANGVKSNRAQNEPGSNCSPSGVTVNPNPTSNKPINKIYKGIDLSNLDKRVRIEIAKEWIDFRAKLKFPATQSVFDEMISYACEPNIEGFCPNKLLTFAMSKGWRGLRVKWVRAETEKDGDLLRRLAPNGNHPDPESASAGELPEWQKLGFNSADEKVKFDNFHRQFVALTSKDQLTDAEETIVETLRANLRQLKPNPERDPA